MTLVYYDPRFLRHETGSHPECPARLVAIEQRLTESGLLAESRREAWPPISGERLARVHAGEYAARVAAVAREGGGRLDPDTVVSPASADVARLAAGAVADAVERVLTGDDPRALCLVRPPGHHALADRAMGFCLFNNVALGARVATDEFDLDRVLIVDWDVHHGNGTQDMFWNDGRVGFLSIHRWPFYPGTGRADETGGGDGLGATVNLPIEFGTSRREYLARFSDALGRLAEKLRPQLVLISAGFDSHRLDPIGSLGLEVEDYPELTRMVVEAAATHAGGRVVSVLEGGYNPPILAQSVELHLKALQAG